jgi:glycosyltransferase involved in cell wall biosynthesis
MNGKLATCTLVVPCYNEAARLPKDEFLRFARETPAVRYLFMNDGSRDGTSEVLRDLVARIPEQAKLFDNAVNQGKAGVVRQGMLWALEENKTDYAGYWDADLATPLEAVLPMVERLEAAPSLDMVFGARVQLLGRHIERKAHRHYLGRVFATVASTILRLPVYDTQCGAKLFRVTPRLKPLFADPFVSRWIFDVEIIARFIKMDGAAKAKEGIYEFPLPVWKDIEGSKVKPQDFFKALRDLLLIRRRYGL